MRTAAIGAMIAAMGLGVGYWIGRTAPDDADRTFVELAESVQAYADRPSRGRWLIVIERLDDHARALGSPYQGGGNPGITPASAPPRGDKPENPAS